MLMKRLMILALSGLLCACNVFENQAPQNEPLQNPKNISHTELAEFLTETNEFRISYFQEDGLDITDDFTSFRFEFEADGKVTATTEEEVVQGTYRVFRDDGKVELKMAFAAGFPLNELNDDWYFISITEHKILFRDDEDTLEFQF
jgi:hypothetical protein